MNNKNPLYMPKFETALLGMCWLLTKIHIALMSIILTVFLSFTGHAIVTSTNGCAAMGYIIPFIAITIITSLVSIAATVIYHFVVTKQVLTTVPSTIHKYLWLGMVGVWGPWIVWWLLLFSENTHIVGWLALILGYAFAIGTIVTLWKNRQSDLSKNPQCQ